MPTLRTVISELASDVKALNLDDRISFRFLVGKFRDHVALFLRQDARSREVLKEASIWKPLECIELEDTALTACGDLDGCTTLKRSKIQIPDVYETNYGLILKITTIDGFKEFTQIKSFDYKDYINREYKINKNVYWLENKRIYIPDTNIEVVKGMLVPKDPIEVDKLNGSCAECASPLDGEVNYPDYLITLAKKEILKDLAGVYKRIVEDEKGNENTNEK